MRLLNADGLAGLRLPILGEDRVDLLVEFAGRIVGNVEQALLRSERRGAAGKAEEIQARQEPSSHRDLQPMASAGALEASSCNRRFRLAEGSRAGPQTHLRPTKTNTSANGSPIARVDGSGGFRPLRQPCHFRHSSRFIRRLRQALIRVGAAPAAPQAVPKPVGRSRRGRPPSGRSRSPPCQA